MLVVRSPVRVSFAGGGTDLPSYYERFGGAVLSTAINKYVYTVIQKRVDGKVQVISSDLRVVETWSDISQTKYSGTDLAIPLAVLKETGCTASIDMFLASEIPPGTGLGSSASVCVNVLKAITTYIGYACSKYEIAERAFHIARTVLAKPVGKQDEYGAAFGGLNLITFHRDGTVDVEPLNLDPVLLHELERNLMLFFTGASHDSWSILQEQEKCMRVNRGVAVESLHAIRAMTERMKGALERGDLGEFGSLLHEGWEAKKRIAVGITTSRIDEAYALARAHGAVGGKITGAGGGGFLLLFCMPKHQEGVRRALSAWGAREMQFGLDRNGAQVVVNDPFIDSDNNGGLLWTFRPAGIVDAAIGM